MNDSELLHEIAELLRSEYFELAVEEKDGALIITPKKEAVKHG